jgi:Zn2+/Cd2+-exporting ATPase
MQPESSPDAEASCSACLNHGHTQHLHSPKLPSPKSSSPSVAGRRFHVTGLDCVEEVVILRRALSGLVGGEDKLQFNVVHGEMIVLAPLELIPDQAIVRRVADTGMQAKAIDAPHALSANSGPTLNWKTWVTAASGLTLLMALAVEIGISGTWSVLWGSDVELSLIARFVLLASVALGTSAVMSKVWYAFRSFRLDMNALMFLAIVGALILRQWTEAATVAFLYSLSLQIESWSIYRARKAIDQLLKKDVGKVRVIETGKVEREVATEEVAVGTAFIVRPGERIGLDGEVIEGEGEINESLVTGESFPVAKKLGDGVFAGTVNGHSPLTIRSSRLADDTQLSRIIRLVSQHQAEKGEIETWVERFAVWYTPAVILLALLTMLIRFVVAQDTLDLAFYNGLALLVIACPCALVISTPVTVLAGLASAARHGILVKGGRALELPSRMTALAFDKTGTLTEGKPIVTDILSFSGHTEEEVLRRFTAITSQSEHPLSQAIAALANQRGLTLTGAPENYKSIPGEGALAHWNGRTYRIGSAAYQANFHEIEHNVQEQLISLANAGKSVVLLSSDSHICGAIGLQDRLRPEVPVIIAALRQRGIARIVLLSGDRPEVVASLAKEANIDESKGAMSPEDKAEAIKQLRQRTAVVGMVGDGVNDAPSLAAAHLGIAMGAGTDVALETADVALINNDLNNIVWLVDHSRQMQNIIRQNIFFAVGLKVLFATLAVVGTATLWGAIAADLGASLLVIFNGLRLLRR